MTTEYHDQDALRRIVYVRPVRRAELPDEIRKQTRGVDLLYAVHNEDGERLALVEDRQLALILARRNNFSPVTVH